MRDWGFAGDYVDAMWRMLQADTPDDYVVATGRMISVQQFADLAFASVGLNSADHIEIDPRYFRPTEVEQLLGDPTKAKEQLGWQATTTVEQLAKMMVESDMEKAKREKVLVDAGLEVPALYQMPMTQVRKSA
jgi:GDPmannose 4,6-dehydratase